MKYDCELIQDIMPLYKDNALSDKSKEIVGKHLSECAECKELYTHCQNNKPISSEKESKENNIKIKRYSKRIRNRRIAIASFMISVILILTASFVSYLKFNTPNFFSAGIGLIRIMITDTPYTEIQKSPRVIIAQPENSAELFLEFVESEGYTYLEEEQMGGMLIIERDGKKENVFYSLNGYFSKWTWEV